MERQGLLEQDAENSYLVTDAVPGGSMDQLLGHSITYRITVGPQAGRKVFTLQTLPTCDPEEPYSDTAGKIAGFSLHAWWLIVAGLTGGQEQFWAYRRKSVRLRMPQGWTAS